MNPLIPLLGIGAFLLWLMSKDDSDNSFPGGTSNDPRGIRNNNPGNLIVTNIPWQGKVPIEQNTDRNVKTNTEHKKFEQFYEMKYGIRAMMKDLHNDIEKKGRNTVRRLIEEYDFGNPAYIEFVSTRSGVHPDVIFSIKDREKFIAVVRAMIEFENGGDFIAEQFYNSAYDIV